jgi:hypothetical protein
MPSQTLQTTLRSLLHPTPTDTQKPLPLPWLLACIITCALLYGGAMGTFAGILGDRAWQVLYSALKLPILLTGSFALALPSFFILNTLLGLRADFPIAMRALLSAQATLAVVLLSLAPFTLLWYASSANYQHAVLFNGAMLALSCLIGQHALRKAYRPLIASNPRHRSLLLVWLVLYIFVAIQMSWVLRPFIGTPDRPTTFFREEAWGNAYIVVLKLILHALTGA